MVRYVVGGFIGALSLWVGAGYYSYTCRVNDLYDQLGYDIMELEENTKASGNAERLAAFQQIKEERTSE